MNIKKVIACLMALVCISSFNLYDCKSIITNVEVSAVETYYTRDPFYNFNSNYNYYTTEHFQFIWGNSGDSSRVTQAFLEGKVEEIGLTETIQKKYINISNILAIVLIIISGVSEPEDIAGAIMWSGVHTCWHALKLYIWGIKMGRSVGDVDTVKLAMDIIDFHPIRLVLIYLIFGFIIGEIIEHIGDVLCSDSTTSSTQSQTTNDDLEKISLDKKN